MAGSGNSVRAIFFALGANFAIAVAKGMAAYVTGSGAMLAETVHSLADCGNQLLLLLGLRQAARPETTEHPLGYGRAIYFWSFLVAVMLFSVGGMFSVYEGVHKFMHPEPLQQWWWAVGVLVFAIVAESVSMRACLQEVDKARGSRNLWQWFRESRQAELVVIFGEDLAALLGLVFALAAVLLTVVTGNPLFDAIGTIAIGVLLIVIAVLVAIEVKAMLIGQSVDPLLQAEIRGFLGGRPEIAELLRLITLQQGEEVLVSVHARMRQDEDGRQMLREIDQVERALKAQFPMVRWSFFEPEGAEPDQA
ncbi:cation diffusion facilitator family transporter [Pseudoxanthomonas daejeonensis]|jgi:cation diffusion facilitator family transporter|uniref:Cation efflux family transporter n=1 Tax=Pseudoxanthomonas daejeonensis TaxID=266062 RepID=A0ABQ6Z8X7_9GAMM|nr:cation diffusion facilitator family transporter [Pseudoxanthomonas daejeonensis]KAF1695939.1 cation efflux family transporter [Pseudoxanthomonas daejeonensis]UNK57624.1 cation diffusion facilitator family transporter [Pseudoxanthomonas daejeonensis]